MTIRELVVSKLTRFTDIDEARIAPVAQEIASALGRVAAESRTLTAVAKKDGVYFGENTRTKLPGTPANRLYAAVCQLENVVDKVTSAKGQYQVDIPLEFYPRVAVSQYWLSTYDVLVEATSSTPPQ